jgi:hypothetical protein
MGGADSAGEHRDFFVSHAGTDTAWARPRWPLNMPTGSPRPRRKGRPRIDRLQCGSELAASGQGADDSPASGFMALPSHSTGSTTFTGLSLPRIFAFPGSLSTLAKSSGQIRPLRSA